MGKIIRSKDELSNTINTLNREHVKIVMVNGCFDLFHVGHLSLLRFAKSQGDILVAAVNSDLSINNIKGASRPIIPQEDRIKILASIVYVDYAILFNEDNPSLLISIVKPDAIVKEEEYRSKKISEIATIKKYDIDLIFYKKENNVSTSLIINKILEAVFNNKKVECEALGTGDE